MWCLSVPMIQIPPWLISSPDVRSLEAGSERGARRRLRSGLRGSPVGNHLPQVAPNLERTGIWEGTVELEKTTLKFHSPVWAHGQPSWIPASAERFSAWLWVPELLISTCKFIVFMFGLEKSPFLPRLISLTASECESSIQQNITLSKVKRQVTDGEKTFGIQKRSRLIISRGGKEHLSIN